MPHHRPFPKANAYRPATGGNPHNGSGGRTGLPLLQWQSIFPTWATAASQEAESVVLPQLAFARPRPLAPKLSLAPDSGSKTTAPPFKCNRRGGPPTGHKAIKGGWAAAYATIFSSTIQPNGQPTNFAVSVTGFSVTVVHIC
jgi:hypothetical protein